MEKGIKFYVLINGKFVEQRIPDVVIDNVTEDEGLMSIFANSLPEEYMNQILHMCVFREHKLKAVEHIIKR